MLGEVLGFAAFLLLFAMVILVQQTDVGSTSVAPRGVSDARAPAAPGATGGVLEDVQASRP
jgi:hypothetical protein